MRSVDEDRILIFVLFFNFHFETERKLTTPMSPTSRHSSTSLYHPAEGKGVDGCELDVIGVWWQLKLNPVAMRYKNKNTHISFMVLPSELLLYSFFLFPVWAQFGSAPSFSSQFVWCVRYTASIYSKIYRSTFNIPGCNKGNLCH